MSVPSGPVPLLAVALEHAGLSGHERLLEVEARRRARQATRRQTT